MLKISLAQLEALFESLGRTRKVYLPVDKPTGAEFKLWEKGDAFCAALNTNRSAKDFFFPQTENMMNFKREGQKIEVSMDAGDMTPFVIFGVRACDAKSFGILDSVFLDDPVDFYYKSKRERGTVVTLACLKPEETCFCRAFGIDAAAPGGDVSSWITDGELFFQANTEKGEKLLAEMAPFLEEGGEAIVEAQKNRIRKTLDALPLTRDLLPLQNSPEELFQTDKMMDFFRDPKWEALSEACLSCGTCTFICPTCQCYDICDFDGEPCVKRYRVWDSCMYSEFTKMAAENPRHTKKERFRQRYMHKLVYHPAKHGGEFGCVGCGRCLLKCPISMNIVKVMKELGGKE